MRYIVEYQNRFCLELKNVLISDKILKLIPPNNWWSFITMFLNMITMIFTLLECLYGSNGKFQIYSGSTCI